MINELIINGNINTNEIEKRIYEIRGKQVMLDSDIAQLFEVETKNLNKQMKRNIERFPEDFCFKLNSIEFNNQRFQNVTFNSSVSGRKYLPYVYTEHGIIALAGVLKSEIAAKMSVEIARAFVSMRNFILENKDFMTSLAKVQDRQIEFEKITNQRFFEINNKMERLDIPKESLFFKDSWYDAYDFIVTIIQKANSSILVIDPYCDSKIFTYLKHKKEGVKVSLIKGNQSKLSNEEIVIFEEQYGIIKVSNRNDIHDRFLIIDEEECYSMGTSLNYVGNKLFSIHKIEDKKVINTLVNDFI